MKSLTLHLNEKDIFLLYQRFQSIVFRYIRYIESLLNFVNSGGDLPYPIPNKIFIFF